MEIKLGDNRIWHFKAWDSKSTLGELCLKTERLVLIFRDAVFSISSFSVLKSCYQVVKNFALVINPVQDMV